MYNYTNRYQQQFLASLDTSSFKSICTGNINFFNQKIYPTFNFSQFANRTQRATRPLEYAEDLITYITLYGLQHHQRISSLFEHLETYKTFASGQQPINLAIVDYGCGQGIATIALIEHLIASGQKIDHLEVLLIEPSKMAIERAALWIEAICTQHPSIQLNTHLINQGFDALDEKFLNFNTNKYPYIHLFSNILDIHYKNYFNLEQLGHKIIQQQGQHSFIAISPDYLDGQSGFHAFDNIIAPDHVLMYGAAETDNIEGFNYKFNTFSKKTSKIYTYSAYHEVV